MMIRTNLLSLSKTLVFLLLVAVVLFLSYFIGFPEMPPFLGSGSKNDTWFVTSVLPVTLSNEITVVTAYFNLGKFEKGGPGNIYTPQKYKNWMRVFGRIINPLVVHTDDNETYQIFKKLRSSFPPNRTKLFMEKREDLRSFKLRDRIAKIYSQPNYPHHPPNTVLPEYSCAMHAKFECLQKDIDHNYFTTKFFMWLDIGLFRDLSGNDFFGLSIPTDFNEEKVAYSEVYQFTKNLSFRNLVYGNKVWVGGASNLGTGKVLHTFAEEYQRYINKYIDQNLMSTDQQVIYGMYSGSDKPKVDLQVYKSGWFYLGYLCKESWAKSHKMKTKTT